MKDFKPDFVIATGGYVSGPIIMAAKSCKIPSLIHEQNVYPGLTVKGSSKYVDTIAVSFEETINQLNKKKCKLTGNPIRKDFFEIHKEKAKKELNIYKKLVLIFGGSLGADKINKTVLNMINLISKNKDTQFIFATGERNYDKIINEIKGTLPTNLEIVPYINNMQTYMGAADLVVCRSGAITLSELSALGKPSILIPSPNVVRNHQEQNAREFENQGASKVITEDILNENILYETIVNLLKDDNQLEKMSNNAKKLSHKDALEKIYNIIKEKTNVK